MDLFKENRSLISSCLNLIFTKIFSNDVLGLFSARETWCFLEIGFRTKFAAFKNTQRSHIQGLRRKSQSIYLYLRTMETMDDDLVVIEER